MFQNSQITSGTYKFLPSCAEVIVTAYSRIQIRRTELLQSHMQDAVAELNFLLASMDNAGVNLWTVEKISVPVTQGVATYSVPSETIMILDMYVTIGTASGATDRLMFNVSRSEYAAIPNKAAQGTPSQYWFDRLISPTFTVYLTPDGGGPYTINYYRYRQIQDAQATGGQQPELPVRWLDALLAGLAHRLARIYAPAQEQARKADAMEAWALAAKQDVENVVLYLTPSLGGYWRI